jgi:hypothetical protein
VGDARRLGGRKEREGGTTPNDAHSRGDHEHERAGDYQPGDRTQPTERREWRRSHTRSLVDESRRPDRWPLPH